EVEVDEIDSGETVSQRPVKSKPVPKVIEEKPAEKKVAPEGTETIDAPMPGTILSINVNEGDSISAGQVLLILEAMKMENEIVAPRDGKITSILVNEGASVDGGENLLTIE